MFGFVRKNPFGRTKEKNITIEGMTCHHCEMTIEKALSEIENVKSAKADHTTKNVMVQYKNDLDMNAVKEKVENAGYRLSE